MTPSTMVAATPFKKIPNSKFKEKEFKEKEKQQNEKMSVLFGNTKVHKDIISLTNNKNPATHWVKQADTENCKMRSVSKINLKRIPLFVMTVLAFGPGLAFTGLGVPNPPIIVS